jgi:hypothetical protein
LALNKKSFKDKLNDLTKKLDDMEKGEEREQSTLTPEEQEKQDRERYQSAKKDYYQHDTNGQKCSISQCLQNVLISQMKNWEWKQ